MRWAMAFMGFAVACAAQVPKIWDDAALKDWATPIAALGVRPGHYTAAEYYAAPAENLRTYPVYHPDREPPGYWEWLQKQTPQPLVDADKIRTHQDWVAAGELAFKTLARSTVPLDQENLVKIRDPKLWQGVRMKPDGSLGGYRWVVTSSGLHLSGVACATCHVRRLADGMELWGAPEGPQRGRPAPIPVPFRPRYAGDSPAKAFWRMFTVPWAPDERVENIPKLSDREASALAALPDPVGTFNRPHGSPYYGTKIPDLNNLRYSRYMDATGTHRLRGAEDVARYAAFITGTDPLEFGSHKILAPEQRRLTVRFADEVLYAIGVYLMSLEPPQNPLPASAVVLQRGQEVFKRETCVNCHVPPNYTSGKLTLAQGYKPPSNHPNKEDIINVSVGTDPGLAMKTRKGTGFYKIPSLRGVWYRPLLLHDGSVASLEEMFDPGRLNPEHIPGGWKGPGVTKRAIPGHPFGLGLNADDRAALIAFLRSL